ncbi:hypothetical protein ElyMa_001461500 [Elysia marginata]|uniref:Uncharacterized protein n=1 Tax=Elysia marginata TaxID=1093978 RepID=A0AAV4J4S7_9GAST|nr:hypothetical protein ElyMa_001461500 [Elysia marginata]
MVEIQRRIHDFQCSRRGRNLLAAMKRSPCAHDKKKYRDLRKSISDCDGDIKNSFDNVVLIDISTLPCV